MHPDFFNDDAFSLVSLTTVINNVDHVPGRAGDLAFSGVGEGVATESISIEVSNDALTLIPTSRRGGPAPKEGREKNTLKIIGIPQIKLEDDISASEIQGVREFGSMDTLRGARSVVDKQIRKMTARHDLTIEHLRLQALKGIVQDSEGTVISNLYTDLGVAAEANRDWNEVLGNATTDADEFDTVRTKAQDIFRTMQRRGKIVWPGSAKVWAFVGDNFFDRLIECTSVKGVWDGWAAAERKLGDNYAYGIYEFAGIFFENYRGTDDGTTVAVGQNEARFFPVGIPGLYEEYYAPADFMDTVNTIGLPRYARVAQSDKFNRGVSVHTQENPLPICTRPQVLMSATITA